MNYTNIFEVPERAVPKEKLSNGVPKKTGAPLAKGTCHHEHHHKDGGFVVTVCLFVYLSYLFLFFFNESHFKLILYSHTLALKMCERCTGYELICKDVKKGLYFLRILR